jgi:hypothetical protein
VIRNPLAEAESLLVVPPCVHGDKIYRLEDSESGEVITLTSDELARGITVRIPKRSGVVYFYTFS